MCGIIGCYSKGEMIEKTRFERALAKLTHRGPDEHGIFRDGSITLGQTRLSIIDLERGRQPLYSADGQIVVVANGEIYNFIELRADLKKRGHRFQTASDSEVILHAYVEYGYDFLKHLFGMFAFALYDRREERLLLGRDRLGIKPLYLSQRTGGLVFASEIKAMLPLLDGVPDIDPQGLMQYLQNQFSTGRTTIFKGIERIGPGEAVVAEKGKVVHRWNYWSAKNVEPRKIDFMEAQEEFNRIMEEVMVQHMRSDVPFGLFLSGGVDSAVLLALLSRFRDEPIRTFSVGFPGSGLTDELPAAQKMSDLFSSLHTEITPTEDDIFHILPLTVWAADDLMRDYANLPTCLLSATAASELKVVFSGEGGDEVFAGYGRYRAPRLERLFKSLFHPGSGGFRTRGTFRARWPRKLFKPALGAVPTPARHPFIKAWSESPTSWSTLQKMQYLDLTTAMPDNLLVKADRMMMAWGLEGRVPFLDHRIVEFGLALPDELKIGSHVGKKFLKMWASAYLPEEHLNLPKKGFHVPVGEWLNGSFLARLSEILPHHPGVTQWFVPSGVSELIARSPGSPLHGRMLWSILQFAIWYSLFVSGSGERPSVKTDPIEILG